MVAPDMAFFSIMQACICLVVMVAGGLQSAEPVLLIRFDKAPPAHSRYTTGVFRYAVEKADGSSACRDKGCSFFCKLDGFPLRPCSAGDLVLKNLTANSEHTFSLTVTAGDGQKNSSTYSWFIDTIPPTATLHSNQNVTSSQRIAIDVSFDEPCTGLGGFKCLNSSNCDIIVIGAAHVNASSLRVITPGLKYSIDVIISSQNRYERVIIRMLDGVCTDQSGNRFLFTNSSAITIHFDKRPVLLDWWASVPSYELEIEGVPRTVLATNKMEDSIIFLHFSSPIVNSTKEILKAIQVNAGKLVSVGGGSHGNRRFAIKLLNILPIEIIKVEFRGGSIVGITGTTVSAVAPITFLYDSTNPGVGISTSSPSATRESNINLIIEFTKPVFGFEAATVDVEDGRITSFRAHSRALYSLTVVATRQKVISVTVPAGRVYDISGNLNLASNQLEVEHYSEPAVSIAVHSFVTAGTLATFLAAAIVSVAVSNLGAVSGSTSIVASRTSSHLQGMVGHLQVFVLSNWFLVNQPVEYSETTKGLRWLIPRQKLPWMWSSTSMWPNHISLAGERLKPSRTCHEFWKNGTDLVLRNSTHQYDIPPPHYLDPLSGWLFGEKNTGLKSTSFGLPLNLTEYYIYLLRGEPLSARNVVKRMGNYNGWQDMEMNLFWVGVGGGALVILHLLILLFVRWRTGKPADGLLSVPRFELLLLILILPCISQSSAFAIRGGTTGGIITGALLLAIPSALILALCLLLIAGIFFGSFAQYKEAKYVETQEHWCVKLLFCFTGRPTAGKWFYKGGIHPALLASFGILFESLKGPAICIFVDQNETSLIPEWTESGRSGIGRMRAVSSDDCNEQTKISLSRRILGCAQSSYIIIDLSRRVSLGIVSGAYSSPKPSQSIFALTITLVQLTYLLSFKPYIRRGAHVVECVCLMSEAAIFGLSLGLRVSKPTEATTVGYTMLSFLVFSFVAQITNEWYALLKSVLRLSQPQKCSFKQGMKIVAKGLILPCLPRKHWQSNIPEFSQLKTGLAPVVPSSPEPEHERRGPRVPCGDTMSATVVPVLSPDSGGRVNVQFTGPTTVARAPGASGSVEGKRLRGERAEQKSEIKKLRQLAKASFSRDRRGDEASTSCSLKS